MRRVKAETGADFEEGADARFGHVADLPDKIDGFGQLFREQFAHRVRIGGILLRG